MRGNVVGFAQVIGGASGEDILRIGPALGSGFF